MSKLVLRASFTVGRIEATSKPGGDCARIENANAAIVKILM
jgi:hypothetical protein